MFDLAALIIHLRAPRPMHIYNHMGRAIFQSGLVILNVYNPALGADVHDEDAEKPFTASGLMRGDTVHFGDLEAGDACWLRFTALSAQTVAALDTYRMMTAACLREGQTVYIEIDRVLWEVTTVTWDDARLPGLNSYQQLIERHRETPPESSHTLTFRSATTFRSNGLITPLPRPDLVFGSLLNRWIAFTAHRLRDLPDDQLMQFLTHHLSIGSYQTETAHYKGKHGVTEVGFTGTVTFDVRRASEHLHKREPEIERTLRHDYIWCARTVNLLADFAYYSGVGRKTTNGMGMVRP